MGNKALKTIIALAIGGVAVWMFLKVKEARAEKEPVIPTVVIPKPVTPTVIIPTPKPKTTISFDISTGTFIYTRDGESYNLSLWGQRKEDQSQQEALQLI